MRNNQLAAVFALLFSLAAFAQKNDKIIKRDYDVIECKVTKVSDQTVEFTYPQESVVNSLAVSKIAKIEFASGRVQNFTVTESDPEVASANHPSGSDATPVVLKANTIAVLPVPFINSQNMENSTEMAKFAQSDIYNKLLDKSANIFPLTVQDLRTTHSLLHKAGIDQTNIDETPVEDLQKILGDDNIIAAKVSYTVTENQTTTTANTGNAKVSGNKMKTNDYSATNSNKQLQYAYHVYFDMYKNGTKIYSKNREPILYFKESWMDSVSYLLKRSPVYVK